MSDPMQLAAMLQGDPRLGALAGLCDQYTEEERISAIRALGPAEMARLYERAEDQKLLVESNLLVPAEVPPGAAVRWEGKNSLLLFSRFAKIFTRDSQGALVGRNAGSMEWLIGPGYYTTRVEPARPWEFLIDYTLEPAEGPPGWPKVKKNSRGASWFVFHDMHDYLRPVGKNVAIGAAYQGSTGKFRGKYFALARGATLAAAEVSPAPSAAPEQVGVQ